MIITAVLLHNEHLYSVPIQPGQEVSIGSGKKDDVKVAEFGSNQIDIKWKDSGVRIYAKKAYGFELDVAPLNTVLVLSNETNTILYF